MTEKSRLHDVIMSVMENNHGAFKKLAALERKERTLEQWNIPNECCITCKGFDNDKCYTHLFDLLYNEAERHTCDKHDFKF